MTHPKLWCERRDVKTSRLTDADARIGHRLPGKWLTVSAFACTDADCVCGGYEVLLRHHEKWAGGGSCVGPIWPVLGCRSREEVRDTVRALLRLGKPMNGNDRDDVAAKVREWAAAKGYSAANAVVWCRVRPDGTAP